MKPYHQILEDLKNDCPGIMGSIVVSDSEGILASDLPRSYSECNLTTIARNLTEIYSAFDLVLLDKTGKSVFDEVTFKYDSLWLLGRRTTFGFLIIIADTVADLAKINRFGLQAARKLANIVITTKSTESVH